jgi:exosome complex RNA-binding protein Rrp4
MQVVLPGDEIEYAQDTKEVRIGPGLVHQQEKIIACKAGILHRVQQNNCTNMWVEVSHKRVKKSTILYDVLFYIE